MDRAVARGISSYFTFTLATDTGRSVVRLPHVLTNWLSIVAVAFAWWRFGTEYWQVLTFVTIACLIYSIGRAARHLPAHRKTTAELLQATTATFKHPRSTRTKPVKPQDRVTITRWAGPKRPLVGAIVYSEESAAAAPATRALAEQAIEKATPRKPKQAVVFTHEAAGQVGFQVVGEDDPRVAQRKTRIWVDQTLSTLFAKSKRDLAVDIDWVDADIPDTITVEYSANESIDRVFRDTIERQFDDRVDRGREWLYDWATSGVLVITGEDADSPAAQRKRAARKVADVLIGAVTRAGGRLAGRQTTVTVTDWIPEDANTAANTPVAVEVGFGTADFSEVATRHLLSDRIDQALENEWHDRVWIADWSFGHNGQITLRAVPKHDPNALRKAETKRIRLIVTSTFPKDPSLDVEVTEWKSTPTAQRPHRMVVLYGTANMTDREKRTEFETHLDYMFSKHNDWRYEWDSTPGELHITAVPTLPDYAPFPVAHTPEWDRWHQMFRDGEVLLGPAKGGYETVVKFNLSPHTIFGGSTGAGKSYAAGLGLYGALMNPDLYELVVIDPKVTDWTWTEHYPNVVAYAPSNVRKAQEQIYEAIKYAHESMMDAQTLLQQYACRNVEELRHKVDQGLVDLPADEVPRRLILFFDEGGAAFEPVKNNDEAKDLQDASRSLVEQIGMIGRAMEHNIWMCAQKPSDKNIGTAIRAQLPNKVGIGNLDHHTSVQVMGSDLCARLSPGSPKGRGWFVNDEGKQLLTQTLFLPNNNMSDLADPTVTLQGIQEQVAEKLNSLGYAAVQKKRSMTKPGKNGTEVEFSFMQTVWVRADSIDEDPQPTAAF